MGQRRQHGRLACTALVEEFPVDCVDAYQRNSNGARLHQGIEAPAYFLCHLTPREGGHVGELGGRVKIGGSSVAVGNGQAGAATASLG